ncbi:MAG: aquaporin [Planctomycetota bacterium]
MRADDHLPARCLAEALGTAFLLLAVVGSGIMADRLTDSVGLALLANTIATTATLFALILAFAAVSGAHFNPAVSLANWFAGCLSSRALLCYLLAQCGGALLGVAVAHVLFELPIVQHASTARGSTAMAIAEVVATFGLLTIIRGAARHGVFAVAAAVAAFVAGGYWFTSSTCFANPAVTLGRAFTDTFAGIRGSDVPRFLVGQLLGAGLAILAARVLDRAGSPSKNP